MLICIDKAYDLRYELLLMQWKYILFTIREGLYFIFSCWVFMYSQSGVVLHFVYVIHHMYHCRERGMFTSLESRLMTCPKPWVGARGSQRLGLGSYEESNIESVSHAYRVELWVQFRVGTMTSMSWVIVVLYCMIVIWRLWCGWDVNTWCWCVFWLCGWLCRWVNQS